MLTKRRTRRWLVLAGSVVVGAAVAGALVGAQLQPTHAEGLQGLRPGDPLVKVAEISATQSAGGRGVFVQSTTNGLLCLWDAPSATARTRQGGCNRANDPLGGREMMISFAYDGGPAIPDVQDARLVGIASPEVRSIHLVMTDGSRRTLELRRMPAISGLKGGLRAFGYRLASADLAQGNGPAAVVALDAAGREIDRQSTGFVD